MYIYFCFSLTYTNLQSARLSGILDNYFIFEPTNIKIFYANVPCLRTSSVLIDRILLEFLLSIVMVAVSSLLFSQIVLTDRLVVRSRKDSLRHDSCLHPLSVIGLTYPFVIFV